MNDDSLRVIFSNDTFGFLLNAHWCGPRFVNIPEEEKYDIIADLLRQSRHPYVSRNKTYSTGKLASSGKYFLT